jgi:hypothetical protein
MIRRPAVRAVGRARIGWAGCVATETVQLSDGAICDLRVTPVGKQIGNESVNGDPDLNLTVCDGKVVRLLPGQHREHPGVQCRDHRGSNQTRRRRAAATNTNSSSGRSCWLTICFGKKQPCAPSAEHF